MTTKVPLGTFIFVVAAHKFWCRILDWIHILFCCSSAEYEVGLQQLKLQRDPAQNSRYKSSHANEHLQWSLCRVDHLCMNITQMHVYSIHALFTRTFSTTNFYVLMNLTSWFYYLSLFSSLYMYCISITTNIISSTETSFPSCRLILWFCSTSSSSVAVPVSAVARLNPVKEASPNPKIRLLLLTLVGHFHTVIW